MLIAQWDYFSQDFNYELSGESYGSIALPKQGIAEKVDDGWLTGTAQDGKWPSSNETRSTHNIGHMIMQIC